MRATASISLDDGAVDGQDDESRSSTGWLSSALWKGPAVADSIGAGHERASSIATEDGQVIITRDGR